MHILTRTSLLTLALSVCCLPARLAHADGTYAELSSQRIDEIAKMLSPQPAGFGRPCSDRAAWNNPSLRAVLDAPAVLAAADKILPQDLPPWDDNAYLDFSRTGSRKLGEAMLGKRKAFLRPLVFAECLENKGRFLPKIAAILEAYAADPTWTLPAHDGNLNCFHRKEYIVELRSAAFGHDLAQTLYLLGDKLPPEARQKVMAALDERIFAPVLKSIRGKENTPNGKGNWWLHAEMNWNPVCLSGVVGAALAALPTPAERAVFVATGEHYGRNYLKGFTPDGYCAEGEGYWSYGFGAFDTLREEMKDGTAGKIDLFDDPKIANAALYGQRIQLTDGLAPPFADCHDGITVNQQIVSYCARALHLNVPAADRKTGIRGDVASGCMDAFLAVNALPAPAAAAPADASPDLRWFFADAGVLVSRPAAGSSCRAAVAIKSAGNGAHSHNDIGSYVISQGKELMAGDPGGPYSYTNETFGPKRYTKFKLLNSFGHPVPVVADQLQIEASKARPKILTTDFSPGRDSLCMDIASAYNVPTLKKLTRTLHYDREGTGTITVEDAFEFSEPAAFEVGLPTRAKWRQTDPGTIELVSGSEKMRVEIHAPGPFDLTSETVEEQSAPPFSRLGIHLKQPLAAGTVSLVFHPST